MKRPDDQNTESDDSSFEQLFELARNGDANAVGELIDRYRKYLLLIANDDVGNDLKAKLGASDAVQETIMHAQVNFQQFQGTSEGELKSWLKTILGNDIRQNRRRLMAQKRDAFREVNMQEQSAVGRALVDDHLTPHSDAVRQERERAMTAAMNGLTEQQRQVIQLRNHEQKSFEDIGHSTGRTAEAARKFWARSIEALKAELKSIAPDLVDSPTKLNENE